MMSRISPSISAMALGLAFLFLLFLLVALPVKAGDLTVLNTNDITNTNPLLGPLADNGGDTLTHALLDGSNDGCGTIITTDQRGAIRPQGPGRDIGAFEVGALFDFYLYLPLIVKS